jgi:hypothetical protein
MAGLQFTSYVPTALVGNNSPSPTLAAEVVTGLPISTGAFPGNVFYLTEQQANQLSQFPVNGATQLICHAGWYMVVQVAATATASLIAQGLVGAQAAIPLTPAQALANTPLQSIVTDVVHSAAAVGSGQNPVVFLNAVTPGNYTIVQIDGDASLLASATTTLGELLGYSATTGQVAAVTFTAGGVPLTAGLAEQVVTVPGALTLTAAAAASGGTTVYTGTITGGAANALVGTNFTVAGFVTAANNGTFIAVASTATTLTLANTAGVAETHAGTATGVSALVRTNLAFPFGVI